MTETYQDRLFRKAISDIATKVTDADVRSRASAAVSNAGLICMHGITTLDMQGVNVQDNSVQLNIVPSGGSGYVTVGVFRNNYVIRWALGEYSVDNGKKTFQEHTPVDAVFDFVNGLMEGNVRHD